MGAIPKAISWDEPLVEAVYDAIQNQIPADIAQKFGIHPVPIVHGDCGATNAEEARKKLGIEPREM